MNPNLGRQFDTAERLDYMRRQPSIPGREAPVFFANYGDSYVRNPLAMHAPQRPVRYDGRARSWVDEQGAPTKFEDVGVRQVPLDRLESDQSHVSRTHLNNMARRKGTPPPIDVTHYADTDRYFVTEGNHRAIVAMKHGEQTVPAQVTRARRA